MNELNGDGDGDVQKLLEDPESEEKKIMSDSYVHLNSASDVNKNVTDCVKEGSLKINQSSSEVGLSLESSSIKQACHLQKQGKKRNSSESKSDDIQGKKGNFGEYSSTSKRQHGKKHRLRLNRKRKWKPYCKLTWQERMKVEERDTRRAQRLRNQRLACGLTLAPNNTTQFLMNDHEVQEPDYESIQNGHKRRESNSLDSSDGYYSSPDDEEEYITHQFMEEYETVHDEYLNELSQIELVQQWMSLEDKIEGLEKQLKDIRDQRHLEGRDVDADAEMAKIQVFKEEIEKLIEENADLYKQNKRLERTLTPKS